MSEQQWFVVSYWDTCHNSDQEPPGSDESIWTLSEDPKETGWTNDCDQNSYGLTKDKADFFAKAANSYFPHLELIKELTEKVEKLEQDNKSLIYLLKGDIGDAGAGNPKETKINCIESDVWRCDKCKKPITYSEFEDGGTCKDCEKLVDK